MCILVAAALCGGLAACSQTEGTVATIDPELGVAASARLVPEGERIPRGGGRFQIGKPYQIAGKWYKPEDDPDYVDVGSASWYGQNFHGRLTANGEIFDSASLSAAHPTLPLPSYVRVTNLENSRSVVVRVNDRGPFSHKRLIDVSERTAELLDFKQDGTAEVRVEYIDKARLDGQDQAFLLASYRDTSGEPADEPAIMLALAERREPAETRPIILASLQATDLAIVSNQAQSEPRIAEAPAVPLPASISAEAIEAATILQADTAPDDRIASAFQAADGVW